MSDQHTPGPWMVVKEPNLWSICGDRQNEVALLLKHKPNADANARLIAAAPEMLAACKAVVAHYDAVDVEDGAKVQGLCDAAFAKCRDAIAKAKATGNAAESV